MSSDKKHLNRDISWMHFNGRVLQEAENHSTPLIERLRFLGIYSNNLDEFYKVRVASISRLIGLTNVSRYNYSDNPQKTLKKIEALAAKQQTDFEAAYKQIIDEFAANDIIFINETEVTESQGEFIKDFFLSKLVNSLNPIMLSRKNKFPHLKDAEIYLLVSLLNENAKHKNYALIEVPAKEFSRFLILPIEGKHKYIMLIDDVIRYCLPQLFKNLGYNQFSSYTIKITRDAEMDLDPDKTGSLPDKILKGVKSRKSGNPVRLVYDRELSKPILKFITQSLGLNANDTKFAGGRYHNFKDFMGFPDLGDKKFTFEPQKPISVKEIEEATSIIELIKTKDIALHFPYHDFSQFIALIREAAIDPNVKAIKITMYRMASNSKIVRALINAAQNGKKVMAVIELMARFDESANIDWSQRMQESGIDVQFGHEGLKIHSKLLHISRKNGDIACISTGNFHEGNARVYTDVIMMTSNKYITKEVDEVFKFIRNPYSDFDFKHLLVSPYNMREKITEMLNREIRLAKQGKPAYMLCKINHVTDFKLINKIYAAAKAGVKIKMLIRGNCSIVSDVSENIEVVGIVDRYLEHSRIYLFGNGGKEVCYLSSADWMTRNLDYRIEVSAPIYSDNVREHLKNIIQYGLKDNVKGRIIDGSGKNLYVKKGTFRSQSRLYNYYKTHNSNYFTEILC